MPQPSPGNPADHAEARYLILGTAGHIDHGKTSLVYALTGINTDRLPEEQQRGMTIELGFANLSIGSVRFGVVDVPGHERFVRTMVAGATGVDLALLVIAADDSVMPQTREHVEILSLLDVRHGVVALTKADLVQADLLELVAEDARAMLRDTPLREAPIVPVSSVTGQGLDELREALVHVAQGIPPRVAREPFRMAVDRVFTVAGRGTVVTGSVLRGQIGVGNSLEVWPGGAVCKVRDLQTHGHPSDRLQVGQRAALNLIGVERDVIARGCELATPGYLAPSRVLDAELRSLTSCRRPIKSFSQVRLCMGTRETLVRLVPLGGEAIAPGSSAYVQLRSGEPLVATHGQRFIVRDEVASRTIGGGGVLRCRSRRWTGDRDAHRAGLDQLASPDERTRVEEVLRMAGFETVSDLGVCAGAGVELDRLPMIYRELSERNRWVNLDTGGRRVSAAAMEDLLARAERWLERYHANHPDRPGCPADAFLGWLDRKSAKGIGRRLMDRLIESGRAKGLGHFVCLPAFAPAMSAQDEKFLAAMLNELFEAAFQPPRLAELSVARQASVQRLARLAQIAEATGQLLRINDDVYLHPRREQELRDIVRGLTAGGAGFTVSQLRERLDSSRKYVVPLVEYLDRIRLTRRDGDLRYLRSENP